MRLIPHLYILYDYDALEFAQVTKVKFQFTSDPRVMIYMYTDNATKNGMRFEFNGYSNVIELGKIVNENIVITNRISFTRV